MVYRTGFGYDVHALKEGNKLILGGVEIPHTKGCIAHSDGDVLLHALCDALLGASVLGDIGSHFPDTDDKYKNINSTLLLKQTVQMIKDHGYNIGNVDSTICLQTPKLSKYIPGMRQSIAQNCEINISQVSVKATTTEKLGFIGMEEGVSAYAIVLLTSQE